MSMPERYHPECPPDAHKVIRPPVTEVLATLCVRLLKMLISVTFEPVLLDLWLHLLVVNWESLIWQL